MAQNNPKFQPDTILHEVIVGAFRARGMTFGGWCTENGLTPTNARQATFGQSLGETGKANLERLIAAAGQEFVTDAYFGRVAEHFAHLTKGAA